MKIRGENKVCKKEFPKTNGFYMDGYLKSNLDLLKKVIKKDWDMVFLIDGLLFC